MVDEMNLLSRLKDAEPVRPRAFEEARAVLRAAMDVQGLPETTTARRRQARWGTRRAAGFSLAALGAAAAAVALVVTSASPPSHNAATGGKPSAKPAPAAANPILANLAADIGAQQARLPGNATLEIRNQSPTSDKPGANGFDLYLNNGTYYWGYSKSNLQQSIASRQDVGQGQFKRAIAAALIAANGDIATGRAKMAIANFVPGTNMAALNRRSKALEIEKLKAIAKLRHIRYVPPKPLTRAQRAEQTDNSIWMNSVFALTAAPENAKVRAGVLAIMSTMPNVKVTHTTTAGQLTLTVADSWPLLDVGKLVESLAINASTGVPVAMFNTDPGQPLNATYYHSRRVWLANVEAGRF